METLYARDLYGKALVELGKKDPRVVVVDADLSSSTRTVFFAREFPERFFNFGVAEQNMIATAAGLASCGKIVFASTFAMFATARSVDQIRNTICYNNFNVKIVATHGGITVGEDGSSHQALEDVNLLRAVPNMNIIIPSDAWEAKAAILAAYRTDGPFYIRLGRAKVATISKRGEFQLGKGYEVEEGNDVALMCCGIMVSEALSARQILREKGISASVVNIHTIKPIDKAFITEIAQKYKKIIVCEEHQVTGGLYSAVCEVLAQTYPVMVARIGIENQFGQSGSPKELMEFYELNAHGIAKKVQAVVRQKN